MQTNQATTQATEQTAKPAKGRTSRKPATKAAATLAYALMNRPQAGNGAGLLAAHTSAFLAVSGLLEGKPVPRATMLRVWGPTATGYHAANDRIEQSEAGYTLTEFGREYFALRETGIDQEARAAFVDLLTTGKTAREVHPMFKATKPV